MELIRSFSTDGLSLDFKTGLKQVLTGANQSNSFGVGIVLSVCSSNALFTIKALCTATIMAQAVHQ